MGPQKYVRNLRSGIDLLLHDLVRPVLGQRFRLGLGEAIG
jgi:hypothetical protein